MPTYEYQCRACAHRFDARQSIKAAPRTRCPHCGKKVDRLISAGAGFLFKGTGFYTTDYRSKPYQEAAKNDKAQEGSGPAPLQGNAPQNGGPSQRLEASEAPQSVRPHPAADPARRGHAGGARSPGSGSSLPPRPRRDGNQQDGR
jgi:putative FmdB family regulatory protein